MSRKLLDMLEKAIVDIDFKYVLFSEDLNHTSYVTKPCTGERIISLT